MYIGLGELIMITDFKLKITTSTNVTVNVKIQLNSTRSHAMIYVQDKKANGRFVK